MSIIYAWLVLSLLIFFIGPLHASEGPVLSYSPEAIVESATGAVLDALRSNRKEVDAGPQYIASLIERIVVPHIDVPAMARISLGKYWRRADTGQRRRFTNAFKQLVIDDYAAVFRNYSNQSVKFEPVRVGARQKTVVVRSSVVAPGEQATRVDYHLRRKDGAWQIYDVDIAGISLLLNYRSTFSQQLQGESLDAVIAKVEAKNAGFRFGVSN